MADAIEELMKSKEELIEKENEYYKNLTNAFEEVIMSKFLTKEDFLRKKEIRFEFVEIPEWDGCVKVRELSASGRDQWEQSNLEQQSGKSGGMKLKLQNARARLVALAVVDPESGERLFSDEDVKAIGEQSAAVVDRIYDVAARLSGITENDLEEIAKN